MAKRRPGKNEKAVRSKPPNIVAPDQWPAWTAERKCISELIDHPRNVRVHPIGQLKQLDHSFAEHGTARPLVINEAGQILVGQGSRDSLLHLHGDVEVPVILQRLQLPSFRFG